jgi:lysophospholipase L1-like esterase
MSRTRVALLIGAGAATAASVTVGFAFGARMLLTRQAAVARRRIGKPLGELAPRSDRVWRKQLPGRPVELLVLGDSIAAGLGADRRKDTLGARLAKGLARRLGRPVRLRTAAIVGSETSALAQQIDDLPDGYLADVAVIVVGGNDVTHRIPVSVSAEHLRTAIVRLRERGTPVVVGTCPDLGALRPVPQPLRTLGSQMSRQLAAAQAAVAERSGATAVSLRRAVGAVFFERPDEMFGVDRFHPSALGYRRTAEALLPVVIDAVRIRERTSVPDSRPGGETSRSSPDTP